VTEATAHGFLVLAMFALAALSFVALLKVDAPYGRFLRPGWGPAIPARVGWILMESPAVFLFVFVYALGANAAAQAPIALLALWQLHYINRTFVYPFRLRGKGKRMPLVIAVMAFAFNWLNAYINARWISHFGEYPDDWLSGPAFLAGAALFLCGWTINQQSDTILIRLRPPGDTGYRIPAGGLYRWISCPNYLGEILAWTGWAIAAWSLAGLAFAVFTIANLLPRALANHRWYVQQFPEYPASRRALIPYLL
jgi:protein-S-isoprenylcysteine O-methyltransferase Ste14